MPGRTLNAWHAILGFTGRETELEDPRSWRNDGHRLAVRWLDGPVGGQDRLAAKLADEAAADGWLVADAVHGMRPVHPPPGTQKPEAAAPGHPGRGRLMPTVGRCHL